MLEFTWDKERKKNKAVHVLKKPAYILYTVLIQKQKAHIE